ncbi:MAG TPA: hypothetical protein VFJ45_08315 [bacterium]|nr:hypothetical protein [bacterium]
MGAAGGVSRHSGAKGGTGDGGDPEGGQGGPGVHPDRDRGGHRDHRVADRDRAAELPRRAPARIQRRSQADRQRVEGARVLVPGREELQYDQVRHEW